MIIFIILYDMNIVEELQVIESVKETNGHWNLLAMLLLFVFPHYGCKETKILSYGFWKPTWFNDILWEIKYVNNFTCTFA